MNGPINEAGAGITNFKQKHKKYKAKKCNFLFFFFFFEFIFVKKFEMIGMKWLMKEIKKSGSKSKNQDF